MVDVGSLLNRAADWPRRCFSALAARPCASSGALGVCVCGTKGRHFVSSARQNKSPFCEISVFSEITVTGALRPKICECFSVLGGSAPKSLWLARVSSVSASLNYILKCSVRVLCSDWC